MWYLSSWRDLRRRSNAGHGLGNKPEITPPSHSNHPYHRPDGTPRAADNYPGSVKASDGGRALIVLSTVSKGLAPVLRRTVATTVRTAASPLADHRARQPL